jgi:hypothetical protein
MKGTATTGFRRTARMAVGVGAACALTFAVTSPGAQAAPDADTAFGPGTGSAIALVYKVNPLFGNLSFGITAGESVAGHQNTGASAQSKAINLGVIGVTLAGEGCDGADPTLASADQPQPVVVGSDDPGAAQGKTGELLGVPGLITMRARATKAPFAEAITSVAPVGDPLGVLISGGTSTATSGIVKPGVREAKAVSEVGRVSLLGGLLTLEGLHWEAVQQSGAATVNSGTFSLGAIHLAGNTIPLPSDSLSQLAVLKDVLGSLGLTVTAPQTRVDQGIVFVDPMRIGIVPSVVRDTIVGGILGALQPVRQSFVDLLASIGCDSGNDIIGNNGKTAVTVLDLALASISGAGALTIELGGVQATTNEISGFNGLGVVPALADLPSLGDTGSSFDAGSSLGDLPPADAGTASTTTGGGSATTPTKSIADVDGKRGGALAAVAGLGLLAMLLTAEGDRRKMRRAQREIPLEA